MSILLVVLILVTVSLWVLIVGPRWGSLLAVPAVVTALSVLVVVTLTVTPVTGVPLGVAVIAVLGAASATGLVLILRRRVEIHTPAAGAIAIWLPAALGAVILVGVRIAATVAAGASRVGWAMEGDATNNLNYTRTIIADNGIALGGTANPVPIPVAAAAIPESLEGLWGTNSSDLAAHLAAYGWVWTAMLAVGCVVMGAVAASLVDPHRRALVVIASVGGSLLPLTWFVGGLPIEFGYFNMPFALALSLASWLTFVASSRAPLVAVVTQVGIATLLLLTWSPVLLVPAALGLLIAARHWRRVAGMRGWTLAGSIGAVALLLAYAGSLTIPAFLVQSSALTAPGQGLPKSWILAFALVALCLAAGASLRSRVAVPVFGGILALVAACYLAMALFLFISRETFDPWTAYYTVKLLWLVTALLLPIGLSLVAAVGSTVRPRALALAAVSVAAALAVAVAAFAPTVLPGASMNQRTARILGGDGWKTGEDAVRIIVELAELGDSAILWESRSPDEEGVNFWAAYTTGDVDRDDRPLRRFAFREYNAFRGGSPGGAASANALCDLLRDPDRSMVVYTDNPRLEEEFTANCTGSSADYRVGQTPGVDY